MRWSQPCSIKGLSGPPWRQFCRALTRLVSEKIAQRNNQSDHNRVQTTFCHAEIEMAGKAWCLWRFCVYGVVFEQQAIFADELNFLVTEASFRQIRLVIYIHPKFACFQINSQHSLAFERLFSCAFWGVFAEVPDIKW